MQPGLITHAGQTTQVAPCVTAYCYSLSGSLRSKVYGRKYVPGIQSHHGRRCVVGDACCECREAGTAVDAGVSVSLTAGWMDSGFLRGSPQGGEQNSWWLLSEIPLSLLLL